MRPGNSGGLIRNFFVAISRLFPLSPPEFRLIKRQHSNTLTLTSWSTNMNHRLLPFAVVLDRVGMSRTQLYRLINAGEFPKPVRIGRLRVAFLEEEVNAWIAARIETRDDEADRAFRRERAIRVQGGRS